MVCLSILFFYDTLKRWQFHFRRRERKPYVGNVCFENGESAENYLETIYMLSRQSQTMSAPLILQNELSFSKPSVKSSYRKPEENGAIRMDEQVISHPMRLDSPLLTLCTDMSILCLG